MYHPPSCTSADMMYQYDMYACYVWLSPSRVIDDGFTIRVAQILHALKYAIKRLKAYYEAGSFTNAPNHKKSRFFPLATTFTQTGASKPVAIRYVRPLKSVGPSCAAFLAVDDNTAIQYVVKFVERYSEDTHKCLAKVGRAPRLLYHGPIWPNGPEKDGCGPRRMVVMEYVEGAPAAEEFERDPKEGENIRNGVIQALNVLHGKQLVHGDIRWPNILIAAGEGPLDKRVKIIDFDWAGVEGQVKYSLNLAPGEWVAGVKDLAVIEAAHDIGMAERLE